MATNFCHFSCDDFGDMDDKQLLEMARLAEISERYEDMCKIMKKRVLSGNPLNVEERNSLSMAYKNVIGQRRAAIHTAKEGMPEDGTDDCKMYTDYLQCFEEEHVNISNEILGLLNSKLIPGSAGAAADDSDAVETEVFYLKMAGDYYRYLTESCTRNESQNEEYKAQTCSFYEKASKVAENLTEIHPIRLGLALNYSVCFYEILGEQEKAKELARTAFDTAIEKLGSQSEPELKDSTVIMQLLRDNLTLWTSEE